MMEYYDQLEPESPTRLSAIVLNLAEFDDMFFNKSSQDKKSRRKVKQRIFLRRVVQVENVPAQDATEEILSGYSFFGQYGKISNIEIQFKGSRVRGRERDRMRPNQQSQIATVKVTYPTTISASLAVFGLDQFKTRRFRGKQLRASYDSTEYCPAFQRGEECRRQRCTCEHKLHNIEDHENWNLRRNDSLEMQKEYALRDINIHKLDLINSFFFDTNTIFPSITSILRKIDRFTNRKDIFDLQVYCDPLDMDALNFDEIEEYCSTDSDSSTESEDSLSAFSYYHDENEEDQRFKNVSEKQKLPLEKNGGKGDRQTQKDNSVLNYKQGEQPLIFDCQEEMNVVSGKKCRCPSCVYQRNDHRWRYMNWYESQLNYQNYYNQYWQGYQGYQGYSQQWGPSPVDWQMVGGWSPYYGNEIGVQSMQYNQNLGNGNYCEEEEKEYLEEEEEDHEDESYER